MKRARSTTAPAIALMTVALMTVAIPASAAKVWTVRSTDDAKATGTCPTTNYAGYPTGGNCFIPDVLTITVGDTVKWASTGARGHDVNADDDSFRSPDVVQPGKSWSYKFTKVGTVQYYCSLHGQKGGVGHAGKVIVVKQGASTVPSPSPTSTTRTTTPSVVGATQRAISASPGTAPPLAPTEPIAAAPPAQIPTTLRVIVLTAHEASTDTHEPGNGRFIAGALVGLFVGVASFAVARIRRRAAGT